MGIELNFKACIAVVVVTAICILMISRQYNNIIKYSVMDTSTIKVNWKKIKLYEQEIPDKLFEEAMAESVKVIEHTAEIEGVNMFYCETKPISKDVNQVLLLLHGKAFSSKTWSTRPTYTMQIMALLGYHVIAIDLPGYGKTPDYKGDKSTFLESVIAKLTQSTVPVVVVSPSMSGRFSLPLLIRKPDIFQGFVPVAPVGTGQYTNLYKDVQVPTMIVTGEYDQQLGKESVENLSLIPTATVNQILPRSRHPAYLDQPKMWNCILFNFLTILNNGAKVDTS